MILAKSDDVLRGRGYYWGKRKFFINLGHIIINMNKVHFLKPTKTKIFGTAIVYIASLLAEWISGGLSWLFLPKGILLETAQEFVKIKERTDVSFANALGLMVTSFIVEIFLLYLAVTLALYLQEKYKSKNNS